LHNSEVSISILEYNNSMEESTSLETNNYAAKKLTSLYRK